MQQKISVRPGRSSVVMGLVIALAFLVFGIVFLVVMAAERSWVGVGFLAFWIICVLVMIGYLVHMLRNRRVAFEIETGGDGEAGDPKPDFAARLRDLEALRKDGLVTEDEYRAKRAEILGRRW
jgi:hypothetical protein